MLQIAVFAYCPWGCVVLVSTGAIPRAIDSWVRTLGVGVTPCHYYYLVKASASAIAFASLHMDAGALWMCLVPVLEVRRNGDVVQVRMRMDGVVVTNGCPVEWVRNCKRKGTTGTSREAEVVVVVVVVYVHHHADDS